MKVEIQSVKFDADKKLVDFIQAKMNKMLLQVFLIKNALGLTPLLMRQKLALTNIRSGNHLLFFIA